MNTNRGTHLLAVHLPKSLWDAMSEAKRKTGRSRSDQAREAFMTYFGITDVSQPFKTTNTVKSEDGTTMVL
jgi:hypothetical protein